MSSKAILPLLAAAFVLVGWALVLSRNFFSGGTSPTPAELSAAYASIVSKEDCLNRSASPVAIDTPSRKGRRLVCDSSMSSQEAVQAHYKRMKDGGYVTYEDATGLDGVRTIRGCKAGVIVALNIVDLNGVTKIERRAHWSAGEYRSLPEICKRPQRQ